MQNAIFTVLVLKPQTDLRLADVYGLLQMTLPMNKFPHSWNRSVTGARFPSSLHYNFMEFTCCWFL